eukprot:212284-Chlamydomonas_euryale.AAC.6
MWVGGCAGREEASARGVVKGGGTPSFTSLPRSRTVAIPLTEPGCGDSPHRAALWRFTSQSRAVAIRLTEPRCGDPPHRAALWRFPSQSTCTKSNHGRGRQCSPLAAVAGVGWGGCRQLTATPSATMCVCTPRWGLACMHACMQSLQLDLAAISERRRRGCGALLAVHATSRAAPSPWTHTHTLLSLLFALAFPDAIASLSSSSKSQSLQ